MKKIDEEKVYDLFSKYYRRIKMTEKKYSLQDYYKIKTYSTSYLLNLIIDSNLKDEVVDHKIHTNYSKVNRYIEICDRKISDLKNNKPEALHYLVNKFKYIINIFVPDDNDKSMATSILIKSIIDFPKNKKYIENYQMIDFIFNNFSNFEKMKNIDISNLSKDKLIDYLVTKNYWFIYEYIMANKNINYYDNKKIALKTLNLIIESCINDSTNIDKIDIDINKKLSDELISLYRKSEIYRLDKLAKTNDKYSIDKIFEMNMQSIEKHAKNFYEKYLVLVNTVKNRKIIFQSYEDILQDFYLVSYERAKYYYLSSVDVPFSQYLNNYLNFYERSKILKVKKELQIDNTLYINEVRDPFVDYEALEYIESIKDNLTKREKDVYDLMLKGYSIGDVSKELSIDYNSARTYKTLVRKKVRKLY